MSDDIEICSHGYTVAGRMCARCLDLESARLTRQVTERDEWVEFWRRGELAWQEWAAKIAGKPEGGWHGDSTARDIIERRLTTAEGLLLRCADLVPTTPLGAEVYAFLTPPSTSTPTDPDDKP